MTGFDDHSQMTENFYDIKDVGLFPLTHGFLPVKNFGETRNPEMKDHEIPQVQINIMTFREVS